MDGGRCRLEVVEGTEGEEGEEQVVMQNKLLKLIRKYVPEG